MPVVLRLPGILMGLAVLTSAVILWVVALPLLNGARFAQHAQHVPLVYAHAAGGVVMILAGTANIYIGWTRRAFRWHRPVGQIYLLAGVLGAGTALALSIAAYHEPRSVGAATGTLAAVWLLVAAMGWRAARNGRFENHRQWMIRSYVLTWTFVGCRIVTQFPGFPVFSGLGEEAISAAIWVNWVVPLVVCEVALQWRAGSAKNLPG